MIARVSAYKSAENCTLDDVNAVKALLLEPLVTEKSRYGISEEIVGDLETIYRELEPRGFSLNMKKFDQNVYVGLGEKFTGKKESVIGNPNVTHVHIPNIGLLMINEVTVLYDCCTDELQRHLNQEWRILAVCPPNGTRRPDYVIGRTKEE